MSDIPAQMFLNFFLYLFVPFTIAFFFKMKKLSPIIGYMIGGIIIANLFSGFLTPAVITQFAYFGIILLLFTIGLETQFDRLLTIKKFIVLGGVLQLTISALAISFLSILFGFNLVQAFLIGIAFSSSSTTIVAKIVQDRGEEGSFLGELVTGILVFQDIAFIPFAIIFVSLSSQTVSFIDVSMKIALDVIVSSVLLAIVYYGGRLLVPTVFNRIARVSRELLNLFIIIFIFLVAYLSTLVQIPIFVTIFIAGILIAQTQEHFHIFSQIRPLRDILAIIFFIYIGTTLQLSLIVPVLPKVLAFSFTVIVLKMFIVLVIFLLFRFTSRLSFYLSLFLFQIDEDAFILMSLARGNRIFTDQQYLFILTAVLISLIMTPVLVMNKESIYMTVRNFFKKFLPFIHTFINQRIDYNQTPIDVLDIKDHAIICGYGRVGSYVGRALMLANLPFIAVDYNFHTVERAKKEGINIIYGDPTDSAILDYAEIEHAVVLILAVPDRYSQEAIILHAKRLNPRIVVISRVHKKIDHKRMKDLGADVIVQPEFEASLSIIKKIFFLKKLSRDEIIKRLHYFKLEQEGA